MVVLEAITSMLRRQVVRESKGWGENGLPVTVDIWANVCLMLDVFETKQGGDVHLTPRVMEGTDPTRFAGPIVVDELVQ